MQARKVSAGEAIKTIKSGYRICLGHACGEPQTLVEALIEGSYRLREVEIINAYHAISPALYTQPDMEKHFRLNTFMVGPRSKWLVQRDRAAYIPCQVSDYPKLFSQGILSLDAALIQVSPPDDEGNCSLGVSVDYTLSAALNAPLVIAEMNERMPYTLGESCIHISQIDYIVESNRPLLTLPSPKIGPAERKIGRYIAELIPDGATLQIGLGAIPESILQALGDKKDLGVHSGMISDGIVDLITKGVVNNTIKPINKGITVTPCLMGTEKLYNFVHKNPLIGLYPVSYTHDLTILSALKDLISINSALQVDLSGQVNAESLGLLQISGVGGQLDFVRAANITPGGKSIIALKSITNDGKSRIVPFLERGAAVTTPRHDIRYVVTEYGVAELWGKNLGQRREALLAVSHPYCREEILEEYEKERMKVVG